ncbi:hypothetical protein QTP88_016652 [Uroleucon formosanum]
MYRTGVMTTIVSCLERYKLDITAVQEVRWDGPGSLKIQEMTILYSGGEKHERGVGSVIKNSILQNVVRFEPINDRICYGELKGKWFNILLINCYAPTEEKSEEIKNAFYEELDRIYDALPTGKPKIILDRDKARLRVVQDPTKENKRRLAIRQREAKRIIRMNKKLWEKGKMKEIEENRKSNTRIFFGKVNETLLNQPRKDVVAKEYDTVEQNI